MELWSGKNDSQAVIIGLHFQVSELCNSEEYIRLTRADRTILKSQYTGQKCVGHCVIFSFSIKKNPFQSDGNG